MKASRVLLIVVLFVTSLTFGVLYVYRYVYQKDLLPNTASVSRTTADAAAATDVTPQPVVPAVTYSVLPRLSYTYDGVTVGVTGTKGREDLVDYYAFGGHVFAILSTDTDGEDYRAEGRSLAVARFDTQCTLVDTVTLPKSVGYAYLAACMYDYGLLIAAVSASDVRVWSVSVNLAVRTTAYPYVCQAGAMIYAEGGAVLALSGDKLHLLSVDADLATRWYHAVPVGSERVVTAYAVGDVYVVLTTDASAGSAYTFDKSGYRTRSVLPAITAVTPYASGYAVASQKEGALCFFDAHFTRTGALPISARGNTYLAAYDKGILLTVGTAGYLLCNHGDVQYTFALPEGVNAPPVYWGDRFYFAAAEGATAAVYAYKPYTESPVAVASYVGAASPRIWPMDGYLYCLCASDFDYGYYAGSIGGRDVYLLKSPLAW